MKIDIRPLIVITSFYVPGLMVLVGAWMLGFSTDEVRDFVAVMGASLGLVSCIVFIGALYLEGEPIWWKIPGMKENNNDK